MSHGGVFHPGHDALHGITVIVFTKGSRTMVGRWDAKDGGIVTMNGVGMHEAGRDPQSQAEWLAHTKKYGIAVIAPRMTIPEADITSVVKLGEWSAD